MSISGPSSEHPGLPEFGQPSAGDYQAYRVFDTCLHSQILFPELPECPQSDRGVTILRAVPGQVNSGKFTRRYEWRMRETVVCRTGHWNGDYLMSFARANFLIGESAITCAPDPDCADDLLRHLLLNQVLPRYLAHTGKLVLHGSAITLPDGRVSVFLGASGSGKSTLAFFCRAHDAQLIDDDAVLLCLGEDGIAVIGGVPTVRLHDESLRAVADDTTGFVPSAGDPNKYELRLAEELTTGEDPRRLDSIFLLDPPDPDTPLDGVGIDIATGRAAVMALVRSAFNLDPSDRDTMARTFRHVTRLVEEVPVYNLRYPRDFALLPQVWEALLAHDRW